MCQTENYSPNLAVTETLRSFCSLLLCLPSIVLAMKNYITFSKMHLHSTLKCTWRTGKYTTYRFSLPGFSCQILIFLLFGLEFLKWLQVGCELSAVSADYEDMWRFAVLGAAFALFAVRRCDLREKL